MTGNDREDGMRVRIGIAGVLVGVVLLAVACGPGGGGQPTGGQPTGGGTQPGGGQAGASRVAVVEKEWAIEVGGVPSGAVTFAVTNSGAVEHNFVIRETGARLDGLHPGQTKELTVTLQPGTYTLVCDIAGHEEAGMHTTITVK